MGQPKENGQQPQRKIELEVTQDENGTCYVKEFDHATQQTRQIAVFPADMRIVTAPGEFGPELAQRDAAQIRAMIFTKTMDALVNSGKVDLG